MCGFYARGIHQIWSLGLGKTEQNVDILCLANRLKGLLLLPPSNNCSQTVIILSWQHPFSPPPRCRRPASSPKVVATQWLSPQVRPSRPLRVHALLLIHSLNSQGGTMVLIVGFPGDSL